MVTLKLTPSFQQGKLSVQPAHQQVRGPRRAKLLRSCSPTPAPRLGGSKTCTNFKRLDTGTVRGPTAPSPPALARCHGAVVRCSTDSYRGRNLTASLA